MSMETNTEITKLYRNTTVGLLGGVLAGLADYFGQDVVLWRVGAIVLLILTGLMPGLLVYLVAWIIIPARPLAGAAPDSVK